MSDEGTNVRPKRRIGAIGPGPARQQRLTGYLLTVIANSDQKMPVCDDGLLLKAT